jgi:hypothetical protein
MNKSLVFAATLATLSLATTVNAQTNITFESSDDDQGFQVVQFEGNTGPGTNIRLDGEGNVTAPALPSIPTRDIRPLPQPPRKTNREIIEFIRAGNTIPRPDQPISAEGNIEFEQRVDSIGGTTSGQVRIFRRENGQVVEDRVVPLPQGGPGRPVFFRASTTFGNSGGAGQPGQGAIIRAIAASGSRAAFLRDISSSSESFGNFDRPIQVRLTSSTSADGNALFRAVENQPRINQFLGQVFNLFRRAAGERQ